MRTHPISTRMTLALAAVVLLVPLIVARIHAGAERSACAGAACAAHIEKAPKAPGGN